MNIIKWLAEAKANLKLPPHVKAECRRDKEGLPAYDPGIEKVIEESIKWLCRAQDNSLSKDDGVARHFSLVDGWSSSYPETTGYIVPTILAYAKMKGDDAIRQIGRAHV